MEQKLQGSFLQLVCYGLHLNYLGQVYQLHSITRELVGGTMMNQYLPHFGGKKLPRSCLIAKQSSTPLIIYTPTHIEDMYYIIYHRHLEIIYLGFKKARRKKTHSSFLYPLKLTSQEGVMVAEKSWKPSCKEGALLKRSLR